MRIASHLLVLSVALFTVPALAEEGATSPPVIGTEQGSKWTATTDKAAATPEQKAVLKKGKVRKVTGEIINVSCFLQLGKRGVKHIPCGTKCIEAGEPVGIVDDKGIVYTLFAEAHDPRRDGKADLKATFVPLLAKRVTVIGLVQDQKGTRALFVDDDALKTSPPAPSAGSK